MCKPLCNMLTFFACYSCVICRSVFSFWRNPHSDFHSNYTNLYFHQQCLRVPCCQHHHQHFFLFVYQCLSFELSETESHCDLHLHISKDVEHFFMFISHLYFTFWNIFDQFISRFTDRGVGMFLFLCMRVWGHARAITGMWRWKDNPKRQFSSSLCEF